MPDRLLQPSLDACKRLVHRVFSTIAYAALNFVRGGIFGIFLTIAIYGGIFLFMQAVQDVQIESRVSRTQFQYTLQDANEAELGQWAAKLLNRLREFDRLKDELITCADYRRYAADLTERAETDAERVHAGREALRRYDFRLDDLRLPSQALHTTWPCGSSTPSGMSLFRDSRRTAATTSRTPDGS